MATTSPAAKASTGATTSPRAKSSTRAKSTTKTKGTRSPLHATSTKIPGIEGFAVKSKGQGGEGKTRYKNRPILMASAVAGNLAFLRVHKYAQVPLWVPPKDDGTPSGWTQTIEDIVGEAGRLKDENCQHLRKWGLKPEHPKCTHGLPREKLEDWVKQHIALTREACILQQFPNRHLGTWKKQQPQVQTMLAVVMACPYPPDEEDERYTKWRELCKAWVLRKYGAHRVVSILEHTDEGRFMWEKDALGEWEKVWHKTGHLHAIVAHPDGSGVSDLFDMGRAVRSATARGEASVELGQVYRSAGSDLQAEFHEAVGEPLGWDFNSDKYARHDYKEAGIRKKLVDEVHTHNQNIAAGFALVDEERRDVLELREVVAGEAEQLQQEREQFEAEQMDRKKQWLMEAPEGDLNIMQIGMRRAYEKQKRKAEELARKAEDLAEREKKAQAEVQELEHLRSAKGRAARVLSAEDYQAIYDELPPALPVTGGTTTDRLPGMPAPRETQGKTTTSGLPPRK